jgi:hypothetical protein
MSRKSQNRNVQRGNANNVPIRLADLGKLQIRGYKPPEGKYTVVVFSSSGVNVGIMDTIPVLHGTSDLAALGGLSRDLREKQKTGEVAVESNLSVGFTLEVMKPLLSPKASEAIAPMLRSGTIVPELKSLVTEYTRDQAIVERLRTFLLTHDNYQHGFGMLMSYVSGILEVSQERIEHFLMFNRVLPLDEAIARAKLCKGILNRLKNFPIDRSTSAADWSPYRILFGTSVEKVPRVSAWELRQGVLSEKTHPGIGESVSIPSFEHSDQQFVAHSVKVIDPEDPVAMTAALKEESFRLIPKAFADQGLNGPPGFPSMNIVGTYDRCESDRLRELGYRLNGPEMVARKREIVEQEIERLRNQASKDVENEKGRLKEDADTQLKTAREKDIDSYALKAIRALHSIDVKTIDALYTEPAYRDKLVKTLLAERATKYQKATLKDKPDKPTSDRIELSAKIIESRSDRDVKMAFLKTYPRFADTSTEDRQKRALTQNAISRKVMAAWEDLVDPKDGVHKYKMEILQQLQRFQQEEFQLEALRKLVGYYQSIMIGKSFEQEEDEDGDPKEDLASEIW